MPPSEDPIVLVVDDEIEYLEDFKSLFSRKFNILTADSGEKALKLLENNPIGVILSDQRMPKMTGSQFFTQVAEKYPKTIRILLTGYSDSSGIMEAQNKGKIFLYLTKDVALSDLEEALRQAIDRFKSEIKCLTSKPKMYTTPVRHNLSATVYQRHG